jgi:hypothetical protein
VTRVGKSSGVVDLDNWVAFGDQKPHESVHDGAQLLGSNSGAERSLREYRLSFFNDSAFPRFEDREVDKNHETGALNPYGARFVEELREVRKPQERSAANSDMTPQAREVA